MSSVVDSVGSLFGSESEGSKASRHGSERQMGYQKEALDYLKDVDKVPRELREDALGKLGGVYGLQGGDGNQQDLITRATNSPLYGAIMGGQKAGEEAIMRNASMTGGLRSGNVQSNFMDFNTQLQNQALLASYNEQLQGLQGMANLSSGAPGIANQYNTMGQTYGMGRVAQQQSQAAAQQAGMGNLMGIGKMFAGGMF